MPANPRMKPLIAFGGMDFLLLNNPITTIHKGNVAPMIEPSPAEIYFTPQVDSALLNMKFKKLNIRIGPHSLPRGHTLPLLMKNPR
jgi:hypothetical protein